jgi:integrase/recombinase XerC
MIGKGDSVLEGGDGLAVVPSDRFVAAASYRPTINEAVESYLLQLPSKESRQTYAKNLRYFAEYLGAKSAADALARLVNGGRVAARLLLDKYVEAMREQGRKANTINARLAALRCAMACLYDMELISWTIKYKGVKTRGYRDMKGPSLPVFRSLLAVASCQRGIRSLRDPALLRLLFCLGLRRGEVSSLDIAHYSRSERRLAVAGKGHGSERTLVTVPPLTAEALEAYLRARGSPVDAPLIENLDPSKKGGSRLTGSGIHLIVKLLSQAAGLEPPTSPHRLRHGAVGAALDGTHGDVRRVRKFTRHERIETVLTYDDDRKDDAGEIATMLDVAVGTPEVEGAAFAETQSPFVETLDLANAIPVPVEAPKRPVTRDNGPHGAVPEDRRD